jgi:plastocyanin
MVKPLINQQIERVIMNRTVKIIVVVTALALIALAVGCSRSKAPDQAVSTKPQAKSIPFIRTSLTGASAYSSELKAEPAEVKAGEQATLIFTIKDERGAAVRDLQIVHEKPMHLLVVSDDLAQFDHVHPEPQGDGTMKVTYRFPNGGGYKLYADFTPPGGHQVVERYDVTVGGSERARTPLVEDKSLTKTVDGLTVTMFPDKPIRAGEELMLNFAVADSQTGAPVKDLEQYLGALAHFVIISEDSTDFLHVHPMEAKDTKQSEGDHADMKMTASKEGNASNARTPAVSAHTTFPRAGLFKLWAQFQRGGRVITVPFVVLVGEGGAANTVLNNGKVSAPADALKVMVSGAGFEPSQLSVKKGEPVKIAFYRSDAQNCAGEVVFPALNIRKGLKVGETTVVEFTPKESGDLAFACGMGMMSGKLVVTN